MPDVKALVPVVIGNSDCTDYRIRKNYIHDHYKWGHPDGIQFWANVKDLAVEDNVIIHSGQIMVPLRSKFSQTIHLDDLAVDFPELSIIAAHAGGRFGYKQMLSLMGIKLNIMVDISSWQIYAQQDYSGFCRALREFIDFAELDRILFGSDSPSFRSFVSNADWVQLFRDLPRNAPEGIKFTDKEIEQILGNNALRLLGLS